MTTVDFITELFCRVDDQIGYLPKHSQARLFPSEVVTVALLHALTGKGQRSFWRWLRRDYQSLFPNLPERTRLFRLFNSHWHLIGEFLVAPSLIGVIDSYGIAPQVAPVASTTGRAQCKANRQERQVESTLDCGRQALLCAGSLGAHCRLGV